MPENGGPHKNSNNNHEEVKSLLASSSSTVSTLSPVEEDEGNQKNAASKPSRNVLLLACCRGDAPKQSVAVLLILILVGWIMFSPGSSSSNNNYGEIHQSIHNITNNSALLPGNNNDNTKPKTPPRPSAPPLNVAALQAQFATARSAMVDRLRHEYGDEALHAMFFPYDDDNVSVARTLFGATTTTTTSPSPQSEPATPSLSLSWQRFQRKLLLKLLLAQGAATDAADATTLIWATGGHSSAAGHGNFYDESYTAQMERAAAPVAQVLGIALQGRNYAMGGTSSCMELALCGRAIYGNDVDLVSWDFGMTDGSRNPWKQDLFHRRTAGVMPSRPIGVALHSSGRGGLVQRLERDYHLAVLLEDAHVHEQIMNAIPDSFGKTEDELLAMPAGIRNFRCGDQVEAGAPYCARDKYNHTDCVKRKFQAKWHPGYKYQAVMGNLMALLIVEGLQDALEELDRLVASTSSSDATTLYQTLKASEDEDYQLFRTAPVHPADFSGALDPAEHEGFDFTVLATQQTFCHTARLPAEIRHLGILTESTQTGFTTFDQGTFLKDALATPSTTDDHLRLVYDDSDRQLSCPIPTNMDHKDFFFVAGGEGWKRLTLPNDSELAEYGRHNELANVQGYVALCFTLCPWGKCPGGVLQREDFYAGKFEIQVNGVSVDHLAHFQDCELLKHENSYLWPPHASHGRFEVAVRVTDQANPRDFLRIGAIILW